MKKSKKSKEPISMDYNWSKDQVLIQQQNDGTHALNFELLGRHAYMCMAYDRKTDWFVVSGWFVDDTKNFIWDNFVVDRIFRGVVTKAEILELVRLEIYRIEKIESTACEIKADYKKMFGTPFSAQLADCNIYKNHRIEIGKWYCGTIHNNSCDKSNTEMFIGQCVSVKQHRGFVTLEDLNYVSKTFMGRDVKLTKVQPKDKKPEAIQQLDELMMGMMIDTNSKPLTPDE